MNRAEDILSKHYEKYGYTIPNLDKSQSSDDGGELGRKTKRLEAEFIKQAKKLSMQNLRSLFDTCVELWLKSTKYTHIKTVSDLYFYQELYKQGEFTKIGSPGKPAGEFNLSVYLHNADAGKDYAILESPALAKAFICKASEASGVPTDSFTKQVMECLT